MTIHVGSEDVPLPVAVEHYWTYKRLATSEAREERLASGELLPYAEAFGELTSMDPDVAASMVDALLAHPDADVSYVGAGPVEDWLNETGTEVDAVVLQRFRRDARWREVLHGVYAGREVLSGHPNLARQVWPEWVAD